MNEQNKKKVIFLGTPDFSVPTFSKLIDDKSVDLLFCVTKQDKKSNRGMKVNYSPIKKIAIEHKIECFQPERIKDDINLINLMKEKKPDFIIVVAYGQIIPKEILDIPKACINGHASILPRHRGASPIQSTILSGDKVAGTTTMLMSEKLDSGDILYVDSFNLNGDEDVKYLFDKLSCMTADLIIKTINDFDSITPTKQNENLVTYAPIIKKTDGLIDVMRDDVITVHRKIRAYNVWPGAYIYIGEKILKFYKSKITDNSFDEKDCHKIYDSLYVYKKELYLKCKDGFLNIVELKPEGKKIMSSVDFINGYRN